MIYSDDFVWLHFPKCAGTKLESIFRKYFSHDKNIFQDRVDPRTDPEGIWHDSIANREKRDPNFTLGNRVVICSFRRLPSWLESRYSFEVRLSPQLNHRPELLLEGKFLERAGNLNHADVYAKKYVPSAILFSGRIRFIRTEYFKTDFKRVFSEFLDVRVVPEWAFIWKENTSRRLVPSSIRKTLFQNQQEVYERCPYWQAVEKIAYGQQLPTA